MKTNRMSCGEAREKLPLFVGGDLDEEVLDAVRAHLEECGACALQGSAALRARRELLSAFRTPESSSAAPGLWPGIRSALRNEGLIHEASEPVRLPSAPRAVRRPRWGWALAPVAVAAALLLVVQLVGGGFERGPKTLPVADAPAPAAATEVVFTPPASPATGSLKRLAPDQVQPLRAFQPQRGTVAPGGDASLAGYNGVK